MKKTILFLTTLSLVLSIITKTQASDKKPGAGVNRNGQYMTFYSAGVVIKPENKSLNDVPGLSETVQLITGSGLFSAKTSSEMVAALMPFQGRAYFDVSPEDFGDDSKKRLTEEYARVTGQPTDEITLYAATDTNQKRTLLLPDFYKLSKTGQMAILFHEAEWLMNPNSNYKDIVAKEIAFQAWAEDPQNLEKAYDLATLTGTWADTLRVGVKADLQSKALSSKGRLKYKNDSLDLTPHNLFGATFQDCVQSGQMHDPINDCYANLSIQSVQLTKRFPNSIFLRFWNEQVMEKKVSINICSSGKDSSHIDQFYDAGTFKFDENVLNMPQPNFKLEWSRKRLLSYWLEEEYVYDYCFQFTFKDKKGE